MPNLIVEQNEDKFNIVINRWKFSLSVSADGNLEFLIEDPNGNREKYVDVVVTEKELLVFGGHGLN